MVDLIFLCFFPAVAGRNFTPGPHNHRGRFIYQGVGCWDTSLKGAGIEGDSYDFPKSVIVCACISKYHAPFIS